jgi:hypothetical protein
MFENFYVMMCSAKLHSIILHILSTCIVSFCIFSVYVQFYSAYSQYMYSFILLILSICTYSFVLHIQYMYSLILHNHNCWELQKFTRSAICACYLSKMYGKELIMPFRIRCHNPVITKRTQ